MLALFVCALEFPVGFFKLCDLCGQLHIAIVLLMRFTSVVWVALCVLPCEALFWSTIRIVLLSVPSVVAILHAPMLLS